MRGRPFKLSAADLARVIASIPAPIKRDRHGRFAPLPQSDLQRARELKVHPSTLWYARQRAQGRNFYLEKLLRTKPAMTPLAHNAVDQGKDMVHLHIPRTDWRLIRGILFTRQVETLQGSRYRREDETFHLSVIREQLRIESEEVKRILDDLDSQAV